MDNEARLLDRTELDRYLAVACDETEPRIFRISAFLGDLSRPPYSQAVLKTKSPTPVYSDDCRLLGFCRVYCDVNRRLVADMVLDYSTEERLIIETDLHSLYAWVVGDIKISDPFKLGLSSNGSAGIDLTAPIAVQVVQIDEIVVSREYPQDTDVGRLELGA